MPIKPERPKVRVKVLRGAIIIGPNRYDKGHTFECDKEYAEQLVKDGFNSYEIIRPETPKITKEAKRGNDIQPGESQAPVQKLGNVALPSDGDDSRG